MKESISPQIQVLVDCIKESIQDANFLWEKFFHLWFRKNGTPLFFLFKKNLSVTNAQFTELFSLITLHSSNRLKTNDTTKLLFYSTDHIKNSFSEAIASLLEKYKDNDDRLIRSFAERYIDIFEVTIAVDMLFGSCAVFLPSGVSIDIDSVVFESGYIHSAGKSVFIRNIKKAKKSDFFNNIKSYIDGNESDHEPIPFVVYSHEDFSGFDKDHSDSMDRGIEQCKIFVEKMSMGSERLTTIISEVAETFKNNLFIPKPGDYREKHKFRKGKTIWLISDRSISTGQLRNAGTTRYYICYEQLLKSDSPFFFFDENKPAWKSHTTMPHSLTAALINIARPLPENGLIIDPFGGTGTTWLEVKRMSINSKIICSDLSPATSMLISDNLQFFSTPSNGIRALINHVKSCTPGNTIDNQTQLTFNEIDLADQYRLIHQMIEDLKAAQPSEDQEFDLSNDFVGRLKSLPFLTRILFYIALRAELRYQGGFKRKSLTFEAAFKKSQEKLLEQMNHFLKLREEVESDELYNTSIRNKIPYIKSSGTYSNKLTPKFIFENWDNKTKPDESEVLSRDARNLEENSCDLIICDPPYGFNTTEDEKGLADLYSEFVAKAITALRPKGQLIICLPSESFTGRELPYCTRSDLVSRQILVQAHTQGRTVYSSAKSMPLSVLMPPYYWESERALRRTILHFKFL